MSYPDNSFYIDQTSEFIDSLSPQEIRRELLVYAVGLFNKADTDVREAAENHLSGFIEMNEAWTEAIREEFGQENADVARRVVENRATIGLLKVIATRIADETRMLENNVRSLRYRMKADERRLARESRKGHENV